MSKLLLIGRVKRQTDVARGTRSLRNIMQNVDVAGGLSLSKLEDCSDWNITGKGCWFDLKIVLSKSKPANSQKWSELRIPHLSVYLTHDLCVTGTKFSRAVLNTFNCYKIFELEYGRRYYYRQTQCHLWCPLTKIGVCLKRKMVLKIRA